MDMLVTAGGDLREFDVTELNNGPPSAARIAVPQPQPRLALSRRPA